MLTIYIVWGANISCKISLQFKIRIIIVFYFCHGKAEFSVGRSGAQETFHVKNSHYIFFVETVICFLQDSLKRTSFIWYRNLFKIIHIFLINLMHPSWIKVFISLKNILLMANLWTMVHFLHSWTCLLSVLLINIV